jgi:CheY-like chemotaxis protein
MPVMDGYQVINTIKNNREAYPFTRIVVISATSFTKFKQKEDPIYISGYIEKPINKAKLLQVLTETAKEVIELQKLKFK